MLLIASADSGSVLMAWKTNNEQGFDIRHWNTKNYIPEEFEGIWLVKRPMS